MMFDEHSKLAKVSAVPGRSDRSVLVEHLAEAVLDRYAKTFRDLASYDRKTVGPNQDTHPPAAGPSLATGL